MVMVGRLLADDDALPGSGRHPRRQGRPAKRARPRCGPDSGHPGAPVAAQHACGARIRLRRRSFHAGGQAGLDLPAPRRFPALHPPARRACRGVLARRPRRRRAGVVRPTAAHRDRRRRPRRRQGPPADAPGPGRPPPAAGRSHRDRAGTAQRRPGPRAGPGRRCREQRRWGRLPFQRSLRAPRPGRWALWGRGTGVAPLRIDNCCAAAIGVPDRGHGPTARSDQDQCGTVVRARGRRGRTHRAARRPTARLVAAAAAGSDGAGRAGPTGDGAGDAPRGRPGACCRVRGRDGPADPTGRPPNRTTGSAAHRDRSDHPARAVRRRAALGRGGTAPDRRRCAASRQRRTGQSAGLLGGRCASRRPGRDADAAAPSRGGPPSGLGGLRRGGRSAGAAAGRADPGGRRSGQRLRPGDGARRSV